MASAIHEVFHMLSIIIFKGRIYDVYIDATGLVIYAENIPFPKSIICTLAGPAGSLLLILLSEYIPILSVCGAIQGLFNLLPIYPLDGGRALYLILSEIHIRNEDTVLSWIQNTFIFIFFLGMLFLSQSVLISCFVSLLLFHKRKSACKDSVMAVQ